MGRTFLLLGSGEFEGWTHEVEAQALRDARGDGKVVILPTASATEGDGVFDRWGRMGLRHYGEAGVPAEVLAVKERGDAFRASFAETAEGASMLFFSGGKPAHLARVLHETPLLAAASRALDRGAVWAGCSAGAMVVGRARRGGTSAAAHTTGLGLIPNAAFGVHWDRVRRVPGAAWWMSSRLPDGTWFVGIDERTAILGDGGSWRVHGVGSVTVRGPDGAVAFGAGAGFDTP